MNEGFLQLIYVSLFAAVITAVILNYILFIDSCDRRRFSNRLLFWFGLVCPFGTIIVILAQTARDVLFNKIPELLVDIRADIKLLYLKNFNKKD